VVAVVGDIDLTSAPQLHRHLLVFPDRTPSWPCPG
jgi:hypothetical protein